MLRFIFVFAFVLASALGGIKPLMAATTSPLPTVSKVEPVKVESKPAPVATPAPVKTIPPAAIVSKIETVKPDTEKSDASKTETGKTETSKLENSAGQVSADDPYTVRGIKVDVSAENSLKARDKAFSEGQAAAFEILAKNLSGEETVKKYDEERIGKLVKSFQVESERASGTRYTATLTYHFKPQATAALLGKSGIEVSDDPYNKPKKNTPDTPTQTAEVQRALVLPILRSSDKSILWEESTTWRRAWENVLSDHPMPDLMLAEGTVEDVGSITASEALAGLNVPLTRIMRKYQAKEVLVAVLMSGDKGPQPNQNLSVQLARFDSNGKMLGTTTLPFPAQPARKEMEWLQSSVTNTISAWQASKARATEQAAATPNGIAQPATQPSNPNTPATGGQYLRVPLTVPFANMEEWAAKRQTLESIPGMASLVVLRMNRYRAVVQIDYTGAQTQLDQALNTHNMQIMPMSPPDGTYMLSSTGQPQIQGQPVFTTVYPNQGQGSQPQQIQQPMGQPEQIQDPRYQDPTNQDEQQ